MKKYFVALVFAFAAAGASADQMFRWSAVGSTEPLPITLTMVFTDDTVADGYLHFETQRCNSVTLICPFTGSQSLVSFDFRGSGSGIHYVRPGATFHVDPTEIVLDIFFLTNGTIAGNIVAQNWESGVELQSVGDIFHLVSYGSDAGNPGCFASQECRDNARGQISIVPEPTSATLFSIGFIACLAAFLMRRRHRAGR